MPELSRTPVRRLRGGGGRAAAGRGAGDPRGGQAADTLVCGSFRGSARSAAFSVGGSGGDMVVDVAGAVRAAGRLPDAGRQPRRRRGASGPGARRPGATLEAINLAATARRRAAGGGAGEAAWRRRRGAPARAAKKARSASAPRPSSSSNDRGDRPGDGARASSSSATNTGASPRSTSSIRSPESGRRRWSRCGRGCSPERCDRGRPPLPILIGIAAARPRRDRAQRRDPRQRRRRGWDGGCRSARRRWRAASSSARTRRSTRRRRKSFRRAGLSHLLAVSGQNITLLALLALPLLAALGIPLRQRLLWVLGLIAVYVPLAGAGPSMQRAGVMGALGAAGDAGRRGGLAPLRAGGGGGGDAGGRPDDRRRRRLAAQLRRRAGHPRSWRRRCGRRSWPGSARGRWRRALAEGVAMTVAATLATAPLIAFHFETLSTTALLANVLALPAVAPAMWLGMLRRRARAGAGPAARAPQRPRRPAARLRRPGRGLVRRPELGRAARCSLGGRRPARRLPAARPSA